MEYQDPLISRYQIDEFTEFMILKNLSPRTIKTYPQQVLNIICWHHAVYTFPPLRSINRSETSEKTYVLMGF